MQHKFVGDIGDYIKLALLRQLSPGYDLGVVWWRFPDELDLSDGRHVDYLSKEDWRKLDPPLFDHLQKIVREGRRDLTALQEGNLLNARFYDEEVPQPILERVKWLEQALTTVQDCNLVFLDPDNGLEPRTYTAGRKKAGKSVAYAELSAFQLSGRAVIVYHHQTRAKGGHLEEIQALSERLRHTFHRVDAIRAKPYSPRAFFLLDGSPDLVERAQELCEWWEDKLTFHPYRSP